jgi:hypothetical protein
MEKEIIKQKVETRIYTIRGVQVILDKDLAALYGVTTSRLNEQVRRNLARFPEDFMFILNTEEFKNWMSQNAISNTIKMGMRKKPAAFTELGVAVHFASPLKPINKRSLKCEIYFTSHLKLQTSHL